MTKTILLLRLLSGSFCLALGLAGCQGYSTAWNAGNENLDRLILLVDDGTSENDPMVGVWRDAAQEEGLHLEVMTDSDYLSPIRGLKACAGVIIPDHVHVRASDLLLRTLEGYVREGGSVMIVYDAGSRNLRNRYNRDRSRLSPIAGIDYVLYDKLKDNTTQWGKVWGTHEAMAALGIPPGKYGPLQESGPDSKLLTLTRYQFGELRYPVFVTRGSYDGDVILDSAHGVVAGTHNSGKGKVLFVNLPLGYLKGQTDGMLLHCFLHYFAVRMLSLPSMASAPDGVGGLVLNMHLDSNAALAPLQEMYRWGIFDHGPYSIHITAGPDSRTPGDRLGLNVPANPEIRQWIHFFVEHGDAIGSHGGWAHDFFGLNVNESNGEKFEPYLVLNKNALEAVTGKPVVEYSSPDGNEPTWITEWLKAHGFRAYYFTGNTGMGPTESYRDGVSSGDIWCFPILHYGRFAALEEMEEAHVSNQELLAWLIQITDFTRGEHVVRLMYFHPPGSLAYRQPIQAWMLKAAQLAKEQQFHWYTMTEIAAFLDARRQVQWHMSRRGDNIQINTGDAQTLAHQAWLLPRSRYADPTIIEGNAVVRADGQQWIIAARGGRYLKFEARLIN